MIIPKQILAKFYDLEKVNKDDLIYAIDLLSSLINTLEEKINQQTENVERLLEEVIDLKTSFTNDSVEDATRETYELVYEDKPTFLNKLPEKFLTKEENSELFDYMYEGYLEPSSSIDTEIYHTLKDGYISENDRKLLREAAHANQR